MPGREGAIVGRFEQQLAVCVANAHGLSGAHANRAVRIS